LIIKEKSMTISDVILPDTNREDWPKIRETLERKILSTFGDPGGPLPSDSPKVTELERYEKHGVQHIKLKYHVIGDEWNEAIIALPPKERRLPAPAVLVIHGSNGALGKNQVLDPTVGPDGPYAIELSQRGFVTISIDQFGFGATIAKIAQKDLYAEFYKRHPAWTLDGRRLLEQKRALDVLEKQKEIIPGAIGIIGHSLGGRAVTHLAALDKRVRATAISAGISPNCTNTYRRITWSEPQNPILSKAIQTTYGKCPWEYQEMLSLCAPRALLAMEPWNDDYNPDVSVTFECLMRASKVYKLLGAADNLSVIAHGEGHATGDMLREYAYEWLNRHLRA
jgi:dienelactone hydrolase